MSRILVIDSEDKARDEIARVLLALNPQNAVEAFARFEELEHHFKNLPEDKQQDYFTFDVFIFDYGLIAATEWENKIKEFKQRNKVDANFCFTSYDNVNVNRKFILQMHARNIFYKPFDELILKESLNIALKPKTAVKPIEIQPQVTQSVVAMLKEIEIVSICELGFVTMSEGAIPVGSYTKYLSELFTNGKKQTAWAQCILSLEIPSKPGFFINKFHFIGIESGALMSVRRYIHVNKHKKQAHGIWNLNNTESEKTLHIAIIDVKEEGEIKLKSEIESRYKNVKVDNVKIDPSAVGETLPTTYDAVINMVPELEFDDFKNLFSSEVKKFIFLSEIPGDEKISELVLNYSDIFIQPLDRSYFYKKLKLFLPDLVNNEVPDLINLTSAEKLKALTMVKISEICELYVNFIYTRELPMETFREFAFIGDDEGQIVELPAFCNFSEKDKKKDDGKDVFFHQFVFWGMTDHYLKQIRIWLLSNYIKKKQ